MRDDLGISNSISNIAVSIAALFSGIFVVVAGGLADHLGRVKLTYTGLAFSILGSLLIAGSPRGTAVFLMAGRIIQGLSAACIMPATLALMKAYYDGKERQRALSFWSIGSWGGSGVCALFGGLVASTVGWRWIFWMSIAVSVVSYLLIRGTPESKVREVSAEPFDWFGLAAFVIAMVALNVIIGQGNVLGWTSPPMVFLLAVLVIAAGMFFRVETKGENPFVNFKLFTNKTYSGATLSKFLLTKEYIVVAFVGFTLFGIGLGFYATPSTDAAVSNVPDDAVGSASGIYKMASSLGAAIGVAISAAIFTGLSGMQGLSPMADIAMGRTDNVNIRFAAAVALLFNVVMVAVAMVAISVTVPKAGPEKAT